MMRLHAWVSILRSDGIHKKAQIVSQAYLGLNFSLACRFARTPDIPANVRTNDNPRFALPEQSPAAILIQPNTHRRM